jgi:hypothetical protein
MARFDVGERNSHMQKYNFWLSEYLQKYHASLSYAKFQKFNNEMRGYM